MLGQDATVKILRQFIVGGAGFHQSYLFAGPWGSGKTTLGRLLARALLCQTPKPTGDPCDTCPSCLSILETGTHTDFVEVDAATNSGKDNIRRLLEELTYTTFSGGRRIYLFDECFTEDTVLMTRAGLRTIRELVEAKYAGEVLSFDPERREVVWRPVTGWFDLGERDVVTLSFENGVELTVTTNQKFLTLNRGWVAAVDLTEEDEVIETAFETPPSQSV